MTIINPRLISEIVEHLPEETHELFLKQTNIMSEIIKNKEELYKTDLGFRTAIDEVMRKVLMGEFLGVELEEEPT